MTRNYDNPDRPTPPSDYDRMVLGSALMDKLREAVARHKLLGLDPHFESGVGYDVASCNAYPDDDGYVVDESVTIYADPRDSASTRSFVVFVPKMKPDEPRDHKVELYTVGLFKNTEMVSDLRKAVLTKDFAAELAEHGQKWIQPLVDWDGESQDAHSSIADLFEDAIKTREETINRFRSEINAQNETIGVCDQREMQNFTEMVQRFSPSLKSDDTFLPGLALDL